MFQTDAPFSVPYFPVPLAQGGEGGLCELRAPAPLPHTLLGCHAVMGLHLNLGNGKVVCNGNRQ